MIVFKLFIGFNLDRVIRYEDDKLHYLPSRSDGYASQRNTCESNFFHKEYQVDLYEMQGINKKIGYINDNI